MKNAYIVCNLSIYSQRGYHDEWRLIRQFSIKSLCNLHKGLSNLHKFRYMCRWTTCIAARSLFFSSLYFMQYTVQSLQILQMAVFFSKIFLYFQVNAAASVAENDYKGRKRKPATLPCHCK